MQGEEARSKGRGVSRRNESAGARARAGGDTLELIAGHRVVPLLFIVDSLGLPLPCLSLLLRLLGCALCKHIIIVLVDVHLCSGTCPYGRTHGGKR